MTSPIPENLFADLPETLPDELVQTLLARPGVRLERIVSRGHTTPEGAWYDQDADEWVVLLQGTATLCFADGASTDLAAGDHLLIPAHRRHRVSATSSDPACVWLALHLGP